MSLILISTTLWSLVIIFINPKKVVYDFFVYHKIIVKGLIYTEEMTSYRQYKAVDIIFPSPEWQLCLYFSKSCVKLQCFDKMSNTFVLTKGHPYSILFSC